MDYFSFPAFSLSAFLLLIGMCLPSTTQPNDAIDGAQQHLKLLSGYEYTRDQAACYLDLCQKYHTEQQQYTDLNRLQFAAYLYDHGHISEVVPL